MRAYKNSHTLKLRTVAAMVADIETEKLVQGNYWNGTNGCFIGCLIRGDDHIRVEKALGFPQALVRAADTVFEGLTYAGAKQFSLDFLKTIAPGAVLDRVWPRLVHFMLVDEVHGLVNSVMTRTKPVLVRASSLYQGLIRGEAISDRLWRGARRDAAFAAQTNDWSSKAAAGVAYHACDYAPVYPSLEAAVNCYVTSRYRDAATIADNDYAAHRHASDQIHFTTLAAQLLTLIGATAIL